MAAALASGRSVRQSAPTGRGALRLAHPLRRPPAQTRLGEWFVFNPVRDVLKWGAVLCAASMLWACAAEDDDGGPVADPAASEAPLSDLEALLAGAPDNATLPDEQKADAIYPTRYTELVALQSPVKSQGSRGVCSIFSTVALMEHLYIKEGTLTEPDFSEQFLQWSAKVEVGSFPNTSGSNAASNIQAINRFGIVEEKVFPYETFPWGTSQDERCTGDKQPTICHTNGNPPAEVLSAKRWKLPPSRYVSSKRQNIKAFMFQNKAAVVAGMSFFYQSWNHRGSTLKTNPTYWSEGYVLYPNAKDKEESAKKSAGHSILLVGWDDELEVPIVDENGAQVLDADGNPVTEKGFFLIKNSWGQGGFGIRNPHGAGYGWLSMRYVEEYASINGSAVPQVQLDPEVCDDGIDNNGDRRVDCEDPMCARDAACLPAEPEEPEQPGEPAEAEVVTGANETVVGIPDADPAGIRSTITLDAPAGKRIEGVEVLVDISHTYPRDLTVQLRHPDGTVKVLHDRARTDGDGVMASYVLEAFDGKAAAGVWTLEVADHLNADTGTLNGWILDVTVR